MSDNFPINELSTRPRFKPLLEGPKKAKGGKQNLLARRERSRSESMIVPEYGTLYNEEGCLNDRMSWTKSKWEETSYVGATNSLEFDESSLFQLEAAEEQIINIAKEWSTTLLETYTEDEIEIIKNGKTYDHSGCSAVTTFLFDDVRLYPYLEKTVPYILNKNIISQYGLCRRNDGSSFLILEATEDGNISSYMEKNDVDGKTLLLWFLDVARGLNYLHKLDILFGGLRLENVFVYDCHAKLEHPCVVNSRGINMSRSNWEKTAEVYEFAGLIQEALSKLFYKPQIRQEKFDNNLECCLEDYLAMLASHIKSDIEKSAESFGNVYVEDENNSSIFNDYRQFCSLLNIKPQTPSTSNPVSTLHDQVSIQTPKKRETGPELNNSVESIMQELCNMGKIVTYLEERLANKSANLVRENPPIEIIPNIPIKFEDKWKLQTVEESTEHCFIRVRSMQEGCCYIKFNIPGYEQEFINEYKEQILSLPLGEESDECPTKRLAISKNVATAWFFNHSNRENFALMEFNCEYIMQPKYFLTDSINPTTVTGILYEDAPLGNVKQFIKQRISDGRPVSDQEVLTWGLHLITAIKYLHGKNISHRAICPSHVFVYDINGELIVKLGGLSFAKKPYMLQIIADKNPWVSFFAPETLSSMISAEYDCSSDIYSFGMMLYYMSHECKQIFFEEEERSRTELRNYLLSGRRPTLRKNLDEDLAKVITSCWVNESKYDKESTIELARPKANIIYDWLRSNEY